MLANLQMHKMKNFGMTVTASNPIALQDIPSQQLEELVQQHKLVLLRGLNPPARDEFLNYCESFTNRQVFHWSFGPVMEMRETVNPQNYLFSRERVPYHWDGAFATVPSYLAFSCVAAPPPGAGGETLFCDTSAIYNQASPEERSLFAKAILKYETQKVAHYGGVTEGPLLQTHPERDLPILRYAEPVQTDLNPVHLEIKGVTSDEAERLEQILQERIYDSQFCYEHEWQEGDLLIADNHTLIHGRKAFELGSPRHLRRIQLL